MTFHGRRRSEASVVSLVSHRAWLRTARECNSPKDGIDTKHRDRKLSTLLGLIERSALDHLQLDYRRVEVEVRHCWCAASGGR